MKLSKILHVASVISGVLGILGILGLFGFWGGGMMGGNQGMMPMSVGSIPLLLVAIWFQIGAIHHMILERKGEIV